MLYFFFDWNVILPSIHEFHFKATAMSRDDLIKRYYYSRGSISSLSDLKKKNSYRKILTPYENHSQNRKKKMLTYVLFVRVQIEYLIFSSPAQNLGYGLTGRK